MSTCRGLSHHPAEVALAWLPVRRRVEFNLACLMHQSLAGKTPAYLASDIQLLADTDRPWALGFGPRLRGRNNFGDRSFYAAGPRL